MRDSSNDKLGPRVLGITLMFGFELIEEGVGIFGKLGPSPSSLRSLWLRVEFGE